MKRNEWQRLLLAGLSQGQIPLNSQQLKVMSHLTACRTPLAGNEVYACTHCGYQLQVERSCRDRHCPSCQFRATQQWCTLRQADVLPVTYYHLVFTLPHELNGWISVYPKALFQLLFESVWHTLNTFGHSSKRLDGQLGAMVVLHTWGQTLSRHVHCHCLVPGGALTSDGQWHAASSTHLFPVKALSRFYRGRMVSQLRQAQQKGEFELIDDAAFNHRLDQLMQTEWLVYAKAASYGHERLLNYLGRYTRRIALTLSRLSHFDGEQVDLSYRDYRDGQQKVMHLSAAELVRRFVWHVLPKGLMRIRYYGFLANAVRRKQLPIIRAALMVPKDEMPESFEPADSIQAGPVELQVLACPVCDHNQWRFVGMSRRLHWEPG